MFMWTEQGFWLYVVLFIGWLCKSYLTDQQVYKLKQQGEFQRSVYQKGDLYGIARDICDLE